MGRNFTLKKSDFTFSKKENDINVQVELPAELVNAVKVEVQKGKDAGEKISLKEVVRVSFIAFLKSRGIKSE